MAALLRRAESKAASLTVFSMSAPAKPGVALAKRCTSTWVATGLPRMCTRKICSRPRISGLSMTTWRSKRPGRNRAGSKMSGRFVAAMMMIWVSVSKPSISTKIWLSVCSRSSWEPPSPVPRWRPTASISSMKMMQGLLRLACSNKSRTRLAPTPTNISTNSEPAIEKKATPASPATALAISVLPVPGEPMSNTPLGIRAPKPINFSGSFRNATISSSSSLASSAPATSSNVTVGRSLLNKRARLLPKDMAWLLAPWFWRMKKNKMAKTSTTGRKKVSKPRTLAHWLGRS